MRVGSPTAESTFDRRSPAPPSPAPGALLPRLWGSGSCTDLLHAGHHHQAPLGAAGGRPHAGGSAANALSGRQRRHRDGLRGGGDDRGLALCAWSQRHHLISSMPPPQGRSDPQTPFGSPEHVPMAMRDSCDGRGQAWGKPAGRGGGQRPGSTQKPFLHACSPFGLVVPLQVHLCGTELPMTLLRSPPAARECAVSGGIHRRNAAAHGHREHRSASQPRPTSCRACLL